MVLRRALGSPQKSKKDKGGIVVPQKKVDGIIDMRDNKLTGWNILFPQSANA
jgi:hypothetical protein